MRQFRSISAASRRAADKSRPYAKRRRDPRERIGDAWHPTPHDVIIELVRNGLADLHKADVDYFENHPDRDFRLRPVWWTELAALGLVASNRPHFLLPKNVTLFVVVPRGACAGLRDLRFLPDADEMIGEDAANDNLSRWWAMGEPASAFAREACA